MIYSYGPPHMAGQKQDDQHEHTFSSYVRIRDVALKTCQRRWTIGKSGERGSGISVLVVRQDDEMMKYQNHLSGINDTWGWDVCGVMVIVVENVLSNTSSNPGRGLNAFLIVLILLGNVWSQLFSFQLWINCRANWILLPWRRWKLGEGKTLI